MAADGHSADALALSTEDGQRARAVADINASARRIVADVIRVCAQADGLQRLERIAGQKSNAAVAARCDDDCTRLREIRDTLRFVEAGEAHDPLALLEVNHLQRVIPQRGHEQPLSFEVNGYMLDPTLHLRERKAVDEAPRRPASSLLARCRRPC